MATTTEYSGSHATRARLARIFYADDQGEDCLVDFSRNLFVIGRPDTQTSPDSAGFSADESLEAETQTATRWQRDHASPCPALDGLSENACLIPEPVEPPPEAEFDPFSLDETASPATEFQAISLPVSHIISLQQLNYLSGQLNQCATHDDLFEALRQALAFVFPTAKIFFPADEQGEAARAAEHHFIHPLPSGDRVNGWVRLSRPECGFRDEELEFLRAAVQQAGMALEVIRLREERQRAFDRMIKALALTLDARDEMTAGHSARVANYAISTARHLGLPVAEQKLIYYAALLHDYGKIGVRDEVLCKPSELTPEEYEHIRQHSYYTFRILSRINFGEEMSEIPLIASSHHERPDGRGYPRGLSGDEIHIGARIIAVTDFFDALTAVRHYRQPMSADEVMQLIEAGRDTQFDGPVIDAFRRYYETEYRPRRLRHQQQVQAATQSHQTHSGHEVVHT